MKNKKKTAPKVKKETKRSKQKYPALKPEFNLKSRYNLIDYDYLHKLNDKEKEWLNRFTEEYVNADMNHGGKRLHKTKKLRKDCYDRNNARNRCALTKAQAYGSSVSLTDLIDSDEEYESNLDGFPDGWFTDED